MEHPALYAVAKQVCHDHGLAWTDPRTGLTYFPPKLVAELRAEIAAGAGHECSEWWDERGWCALCDRVRPTAEEPR